MLCCSGDGLLVWTNARSNEHLQAVSLHGPAQIIVNSTSDGAGYQRFATQPYGALSQHWVGSYANISTKGVHSFSIPNLLPPLRVALPLPFGNAQNQVMTHSSHHPIWMKQFLSCV